MDCNYHNEHQTKPSTIASDQISTNTICYPKNEENLHKPKILNTAWINGYTQNFRYKQGEGSHRLHTWPSAYFKKPVTAQNSPISHWNIT